jgi:hypothetical protein
VRAETLRRGGPRGRVTDAEAVRGPEARLLPVEVVVEEEPVKRTAKKEEAPADKKDLSKILDEWDD